MNVFISEYVCGGGWLEVTTPPSLLQEGRAMWATIVEDFSRVPDCRVVTTLEASQPPLSVSGIEVVTVSSPSEEAHIFSRLAAEADACLIIAPELGNVLAERCRAARAAGVQRLLNPSGETVEMCSDKLLLYEFLARHEISTIPTALWASDASDDIDWSPVVVKPRFGAGSQGVRLFESPAIARLMAPTPCSAESPYVDHLIVQPFIAGTAVSVGVICGPDGEFEILPVAEQRLSNDGMFRYLGGQIPWNCGDVDSIRTVVARTCQLLPGVSGYVGFDIVVPERHPTTPLVVEINPRLTTSYLGYRQLTRGNLAERMLRPQRSHDPIQWEHGAVSFTVDGGIERSGIRGESASFID